MSVFARYSAGETRNLKDFGLSRYVGNACDVHWWGWFIYLYCYFPEAVFQKYGFRTQKMHSQDIFSE